MQKSYNTVKSRNRNYNNSEYYDLENFSYKRGWKLSDTELLMGMGFNPDGNTAMVLLIPNDDTVTKYVIRNHKQRGFELRVNDRNHYFKSFVDMMRHIDEYGA